MLRCASPGKYRVVGTEQMGEGQAAIDNQGEWITSLDQSLNDKPSLESAKALAEQRATVGMWCHVYDDKGHEVAAYEP